MKPLGPHRLAAMAHPEAQRGWCYACYTLPVPSSTDKRGRAQGKRYTCRRPECVKAWSKLAQLDRPSRAKRGAASGMIHGRAA